MIVTIIFFFVYIKKLKNLGISNKTIHYKLIFSFLEERPIEVLETNSKTKCKKRVKFFFI